MAKKALLVGINYPGTDHALRGCVNDVMMVSEALTREFGFQAKEKRMLTDESATTANILERLDWLVEGAQPGDFLHFHYSGHGSQMIDSKYDTDDEPDGLDEILCPVDLNWRDKVITDDHLKAIFDRVPKGVHLTVVLDCCHSGTGLDHAENYRPLGIATKAREFGPDSPNRSRLLPMPADIENRGFGLSLKPRKRQVAHNEKSGLLLSGCQSHQTSADAWINNMYCGAATFAFLYGLDKHNYKVSYKVLSEEMNQFMVAQNFSQRPELNGDSDLYGHEVLGGKKPEGVEVVEVEPTIPEEIIDPVVPEPEIEVEAPVVPEAPLPTAPVVVEPQPVPDKPNDSKWKRNLAIIVVVAGLAIAALMFLG